MGSNPPSKRMAAAAGVLNIDDLPDSILEKFLTHLPIRDAAKTSILSKKWKKHWRNIPSLLFDNSFHSSDSVQEQLHYLLDMSQVQYFPQIDNVMLFLRDKDVHEFTFNVTPPEEDDTYELYKIPSYLFSYQQLRHLDLGLCEFKTPPPTFEGFPHLISLRFSFVTFSDDDPDPLDFISKCPLLENLSINECFGCGPLNIGAPRLKFLYIYGCVSHAFFLKNTPLLSSVHLYYREDFGSAEDELVATNLIRLFECLPAVEYLCISDVTYTPMPQEKLLTSPRLPITISHLKALELAADFRNESGILLALALIISSPNLQKLKVTPAWWRSGWDSVPDLFKREDLSDVSLQNLQDMQMIFYGTSMEVEFVKFMIAKSVALKTVTLSYLRQYEREVSGAVAKLASASPKVNSNLVELKMGGQLGGYGRVWT